MSLLKTGAVQVGQSNTASQNFHWRNLLDGLLRLSRGNAGSPITDVMRVRADNSVEFPGGVARGVLGAGQTWWNVTGSRAGGTIYTNSTGKPIMVCVIASGSNAGLEITIGGMAVWRQFAAVVSGSIEQGVNVIVPDGATYSVQILSGSLYRWTELR